MTTLTGFENGDPTTLEDLTDFGYLRPVTLENWKNIGYDIDASIEAEEQLRINPDDSEAIEILSRFEHAANCIKDLEVQLNLPQTGILDQFVNNYKQKYYTHDCLQYHSANFCVDESLQYQHIDTFRQAFDRLSEAEKTKYATTSFYHLMESDDLEIIEFLVPYIQNKNYIATGLTKAAESGNLELFQLLESLLRDSEYQEAYEEAFAYASENNHFSIVEILLQSEFVSDFGIGEGFLEAIRNECTHVMDLIHNHERGHNGLLEIFLDVMKDENNEDLHLLLRYPKIIVVATDIYLQNRDWNSIRKLSTLTGAFSDSDEDLLVWGSAIGSLNLVRTLIDKGIDPNYDNSSAIASAEYYHHSEIVNYLKSI
jgi:hypothetical protein